MNILQSEADLSSLNAKAYPEPLLHFACELLRSLEAEVEPEEREDHLLSNPVILCGPEDRIIALLEASPFGYEYVERLELKETTAYRVGVMLDNDWFAQYLIQADVIDAETERWLDEHAERGGLCDEQERSR